MWRLTVQVFVVVTKHIDLAQIDLDELIMYEHRDALASQACELLLCTCSYELILSWLLATIVVPQAYVEIDGRDRE